MTAIGSALLMMPLAEEMSLFWPHSTTIDNVKHQETRNKEGFETSTGRRRLLPSKSMTFPPELFLVPAKTWVHLDLSQGQQALPSHRPNPALSAVYALAYLTAHLTNVSHEAKN